MPQTPDPLEPAYSIDDEKLSVRVRADIAPGTHLKLTFENSGIGSPAPGQNPPQIPPRFSVAGIRQSAISIVRKTLPKYYAVILLTAALLVYLGTRLAGLENFPVYFFTDEAVQTVQAADLVNNNLYSTDNEFLPTYFYNGYQYNLSLSVYWQLIPYLLFGKSVFVTRAASVIGSLLAALSVAMITMFIFKKPNAWVSVLLLSITPAWFLHSRTAFETSLATSFYAVFLLCYGLYRTASPKWIYAALVAGAAAFYTYSPARMVTMVTALFLLFSDLPYHWKNRRLIIPALGLYIVLALPQVRFSISHPGADLDHLKVLNSYWVREIPVSEKITLFFREYLKGLNPSYWYQPNEKDIIRHLMKGYGHINSFTFPLALTGLVVCLKNFRNPAYRIILACLLAAPAGASLVALGITRALTMVIPLALLSTLGFSSVIGWVHKRWPVFRRGYTAGVFFLAFAGFNIFMARDALVNGSTWYTNYGLAGLQYGARQVTAEIKDTLYKKPNTSILLSPSWTNGTDTVLRFFFDDPLPFGVGSIDGYIENMLPIPENMLFVMTPEEYKRANESHKFKDIQVQKLLPYPNGQPGFYFTSLVYADGVDKIFAVEKEQRSILKTAIIFIKGQAVKVDYSQLDIGKIEEAFDGSDQTLLRTIEANPFEIRLTFDKPQTLNGLTMRVGGTPTKVTAELVGMDGNVSTYNIQVPESPTPRDVAIPLPAVLQTRSINLFIKSINDEEPAHVHLWEIKLK